MSEEARDPAPPIPSGPPVTARGARAISAPALALLGGVTLLVAALTFAGLVYAARAGFHLSGALGGAPRATPSITSAPTLVTAINDPLTTAISYPGEHAVWITTADGACGFASGGYQVVGAGQPQAHRYCAGPDITQASDERVTVTTHVTAQTDPTAYYGVYIRASDRTQSDGYIFIVSSAGKWTLAATLPDTTPQSVAHGTSSAIKSGVGAVNMLTLDAYGPTLTASINGVVVGQLTNSDFTAGYSGFVVEHGATVVYTNFLLQRYQ